MTRQPFKLLVIPIISTFSSLLASPIYAQTLDPGGGIGGGHVTGTHLTEIGGIIVNIITDLIALIGVVTVIIIIVGGIRMILSTGDPKAMAAARAAVVYGIAGLVAALLAVTIVGVVGNFLGIPNLTFLHIGP